MYKYIFFLCCICNIYTQIQIDPLYSNNYRPGTWWPVRFTAQESTNLKVSIDNFNIDFTVPNTQHVGYSILSKQLVHIQIVAQKKQAQHFSLNTLKQTDQLIGIYGNSHTSIPVSHRDIYYTHIKWLPDHWEGLAPLNCLFINRELNSREKNIVKTWVAAGGNAFLKANFMPEINHNSKKTILYGRGKIFFINIFSSSAIDEMVINHKNPYAKIQAIYDIPPVKPRFWSTNIYICISLFCLLHLCIIFFINFSKKNINHRAVIMFILTIVNTSLLAFWLSQYQLVHYTSIDLCPQNNETTLVTTIHDFTTKNLKQFKHSFTQLPMPILQREQQPFSLTRTEKSWLVSTTSNRYICQTFTIKEYIGTMQFEKQNSKLINDSEVDWENTYFSNNKKGFFVGNCLSGESLVLPKKEQKKLQEFPQSWLQELFPQKVVFSIKKHEQGSKPPFAFLEKYQIHFIDTK
ncbi:hypothetical protein [Candidatus Uabimicrobium sp. HlEnr_7]|uniref:hypothetical protein n=1 Tax=Candidatus Uabimicrobium helgolandensis TaxID=3095367 RepID=UPI003558B707